MDKEEQDFFRSFIAEIKHDPDLYRDLIDRILKIIRPGGKGKRYRADLYPRIMAYMLSFDPNFKVYARRYDKNPGTILRKHMGSFIVIHEGTSRAEVRGEYGYAPPYFAWLCSADTKSAKEFYNRVVTKLKLNEREKYPYALWGDDKKPKWARAKPSLKFKDKDEVRDWIEKPDSRDKKPKRPAPEKPKIKRDWIDPYNLDAIPFVGRERELEQLDEFAGDGDGGDFKVWVMVAPSGAGKTRLTYEWVRRPEIADDWQVLYLGTRVSESGPGRRRQVRFHTPDRTPVFFPDVSEDGETWTDWSPDRPHIFIIDYVFGFGEVINGIVQRCKAQKLAHPVRLLVLDHNFPDELDQFKYDARWSPLSADGERMAEIKSIFHNRGEPLNLATSSRKAEMATYAEDRTEKLLRAIIRSTVERPIEDHEDADSLRLNVNDATLDQAIRYLQKQPSGQYPLFAALAGDAIRRGQDYSGWNRRELVKYYLSGQARLPWESKTIDEREGFLASSLISASTILRGLPLAQIRMWARTSELGRSIDLGAIFSITERVTSSSNTVEVGPLEPDFVGQTFFLHFLDWLVNRPGEFSNFCALLCSGTTDQQEKGALEIITFIEKLFLSLSLDEKSLATTQRHWRNLFTFLQPHNFKDRSILRWAATATAFSATRTIHHSVFGAHDPPHSEHETKKHRSDLEKFRHRLLRLVEDEELFISAQYSRHILLRASEMIIQYFQLVRPFNELSETYKTKVVSTLLGYDEKRLSCPVLHQALVLQSPEIVERLIEAGCHLEEQDDGGTTPLMYACLWNDERIALQLIERMNLFDQVDLHGTTALMLACRHGRNDVGKALIDKMEIFDHQDENGYTALYMACFHKREELALALIDVMNYADAATDNGNTPLIAACVNGLPNVVQSIIASGCNINRRNTGGFTALSYAIIMYRVECVKILLMQSSVDLDLLYSCNGRFLNAVDMALDADLDDIASLIRQAVDRRMN